MIVASVLFIILIVVIVIYNSSKTEYALAYTDLAPNDAAAIKNYLVEAQIPYKISDDGKSIQVPRSQAANVKLDVESQGINKNGSIGYEAFRESKAFGMTDKEFTIKHLDALQGVIQQLLNSIEAVKSSKVLINLPEESVFLKAGKQEQASASVVIVLKQGYKLNQQQVDTMYNLVSKSVKNLPIDNITISDSDGDLLPYSKATGGQISSASAATEQFAVKKAFEQDIQSNVIRILGGVLGPGKVIPMAVASINFDKKTREEKLVTPVNLVDNTGIDISIQEIQKSYNSDGGATAGTPGTGSTDIPGYPASTGSGKTNSEENQKTVNREVNHITNQIQSSPFTVIDLALSVGIEPPIKDDPSSLTQQTKDDFQKILIQVVSASLSNSGKNYSEADLAKKVTVFSHTFAANKVPTITSNQKMLYYIIGALAFLLIGAAIIMVASRRKKAKEALAASEELAVEKKIEFPTLDFENATNDSQVRKQLEQLAKKKPDEFVNLLRTWLVDE